MAKRFIDTEIWKKSWFRRLDPTIKLFIIYLFTNCDHAGLLDVDIEAAEFHIGGEIEVEHVPKGWIIEVGKDKWFLPKFIDFQYPKGLNPNMKMHQSVARLLEKYDLNKYLNTRKITPNIRGNGQVQDTNKDRVIDKEIIGDGVSKKQFDDKGKIRDKMMDYFGFKRHENEDKLNQTEQFLQILQEQNKYASFCKQFDAYNQYKSFTGGFIHGFNSFLGKEDKKYLDGAWNQDNWQKKLKNVIKNSNTPKQPYTIDDSIKYNSNRLNF